MPLYPEIEPFNQFRLPVDNTHVLYVEQCGNPAGMPVLVLHGGPGGGCSPNLRRFFDPQRWHVILFDQRGAGKSTPRGSTVNNTTSHLVADMETIRQHLKLESWHLFGGSWGATLALHYGQVCPQRVKGFVLRGVFLGRKRDIDWLYRGGAARLQPEAWQAFIAPLSEGERFDPLRAYQRRLQAATGPEIETLTRAWAQWEAACATLYPSLQVQKGFAENSLPLAMIEAHYCTNDCFLEKAPILDNMQRIAHLPAIVVHGRYDLVCPVEQAHELCSRWPASELRVVNAAGHSVRESGIEQALLNAVSEMGAGWKASA